MDLVLDKPIAPDPAFNDQLARARDLLRRPRREERTWPALAAALLFAGAGFAFVTVIVTAPTAPAALTRIPVHG
jgi:hypothetical protein